MFNYIIRRVGSALLVLLIVSIITFAVLMIIPGDPAQLVLGTEATQEKLSELHHAMGLDRPYYVQYADWLTKFIRGDLGTSYLYGESVGKLILQRLPVTVSVAVFSMLIAAFVAFGLGTVSAVKKDSFIDYFSRSIMQLGTAIPSFWIGMVFVVFFGLKLKLFPVSGFVQPSESLSGYLRSITLPSVVLAIGEMGLLLRIVRSSMLESIGRDYMDMARVKGLKPWKIYVKYALRSAMIAPITVMGMQFAKLIGGTAVVETVFALPGIGRLVLTAVEQRDIVLLQGLVMFVTTVIVVVTLVADVAVMLMNPQIKTVDRSDD